MRHRKWGAWNERQGLNWRPFPNTCFSCLPKSEQRWKPRWRLRKCEPKPPLSQERTLLWKQWFDSKKYIWFVQEKELRQLKQIEFPFLGISLFLVTTLTWLGTWISSHMIEESRGFDARMKSMILPQSDNYFEVKWIRAQRRLTWVFLRRSIPSWFACFPASKGEEFLLWELQFLQWVDDDDLETSTFMDSLTQNSYEALQQRVLNPLACKVMLTCSRL